MKDKSYINLGWFDSITQVWELHPEGGHEGEYLYVDSQKYRWNKTTRNWEYAATDPVAGGNFVVGNDLTVNNCATIGKDVRVRGNANVEKNLFVGGKIYAKGIKQPNLGFFPSEEALKAAYPTPEVGMWASVGTTMPGTVWRCEVAGVWVNTEQTGGVDPTDVNYGIVNDLESESTTEALSAAMGAKLQNEKLGVVPQGLTTDQKRQVLANTGLDKIIDGLRKRTGYFVCSNFWYEANKIVSAPNFELYPGNCIKIKMLYHNEAPNPTLNINNTAPRPLFFDKVLCSKDNTWLDGEVIEVYYDGECYFANSIDGGATFKTGQRVRDLGIDQVPTKGSKNLVESGGIFGKLEEQDKKIDDAIDRQDKEIDDFEDRVRYHVDKYKPIVINGDVTNAPDEEDFTTDENGLLKFKDRSYLFGKGYIILRKNFVSIDDHPIDLLTQEMFEARETIYEIRYDYDLNGQTIVIPEGCELKFNGGSISNGKVIGQKTIISGDANIEDYDGVFIDRDGVPLINEFKTFTPSFSIIDAYDAFDFNGNTRVLSTNQSMAYWNGYLIKLNITSSGSPQALFIDEETKAPLWYSTLNITSHCNGACVKDGYLYIGGGVNNNPNYYFDMRTLFANAQTGAATDPEGTFMDGVRIHCISYSEYNHTWLVWVIGEGFKTYDDSWQLVEEYDDIREELDRFFYPKFYTFGDVEYDGEFIYANALTGNRTSSFFVIDISKQKIVSSISVGDDIEVEGIVRVGDRFYISANHLEFSILCMVADRSDSVSSLSDRSGMLASKSDLKIYVDNTYTGESYGSTSRPFKRLSQAFYFCRFISYFNIYVNYTGIAYRYSKAYRLASQNGTIQGTGDGKPEIYASFLAYNSNIHLRNIVLTYSSSSNIFFSLQGCNLFIIDSTLTKSGSGRFFYCMYFNCNIHLYNSVLTSNDAGFVYSRGCYVNMYLIGSTQLNCPGYPIFDCDYMVKSNLYLQAGSSMQNLNALKLANTNLTVDVHISASGNTNVDNALLWMNSNAISDYRIILSVINISLESPSTISGLVYRRGEYIFLANNTGTVAIVDDQNILNETSSVNYSNILGWNTDLSPETDVNKIIRTITSNVIQYNIKVTDTNNPYIYVWRNLNTLYIRNVDNMTYGKKKGTTSERPSNLRSTDKGWEFFDTTLNKPIYWKGNGWVDATGASIS